MDFFDAAFLCKIDGSRCGFSGDAIARAKPKGTLPSRMCLFPRKTARTRRGLDCFRADPPGFSYTSPLILDVAAVLIEAQVFVQNSQKAPDVNSINIFAKCHHGMAYYPSKVGPVHPGLKIDLREIDRRLPQGGYPDPGLHHGHVGSVSAEQHADWLALAHDTACRWMEPRPCNRVGKRLCPNTPYLDYVTRRRRKWPGTMRWTVSGSTFCTIRPTDASAITV